MAQNFWTAIWAWTTCFVATILLSLATRQLRTQGELAGLVWSLTPRQVDASASWWQRPGLVGALVLGLTLLVNLLVW